MSTNKWNECCKQKKVRHGCDMEQRCKILSMLEKKNQFGNNKQKKKKTNHSHQNKSEVYTNTARL